MIYFVRHGRTEWNDQKRFQGALDSALTERGKQQAQTVKTILDGELNLSKGEYKVFCSPLGRARQTCDIIFGENNASVAIDKGLREVSLGFWDGKTLSEIEEHFKERGQSLPFDWHFHALLGESFELCKKRISYWLNLAQVQPVPVVAVSHGLIGRILLGIYQNQSYPEMINQRVSQDAVYKLDNGAVTVLGSTDESDNWI